MLPSPPKDPAKSRLYRAWLLLRCARDLAFRQQALDRCAKDVCFYIDAFVWQYNPWEVDHEVGPFVLFPHQEAALTATLHRLLVERRNAVWEKSRFQGATWLLVIAQDWLAKFRRNKHPFAISHSEQAVDKGDDPNTLFAKVKFISQHQPAWLTRGARKTKLAFRYPATASTYTGSATTERSGVGGRSPLVGLDEFSLHPKAKGILGQTAYTGPCWFIGTHYGTETVFYELTLRPDLFKVVLHWSQNPMCNRGLYRSDPGLKDYERAVDKDYPFPPDYPFVRDGTPAGTPKDRDGKPMFDGLRSVWYDQKCEELKDPRLVAMHLDINCAGSSDQFFEAMDLRRLVAETARPPAWQGEALFDPLSGTCSGLVEDPKGALKLWLDPLGPMEMPVGEYGGGADPGGNKSSSVCQIGEAHTGRKVAELVMLGASPEYFAAAVAALLSLFKNAHGQPPLFCWETNGPGGDFGRALMRMGYRRLLGRPTFNSKKVMMGRVPGVNTNAQTKKDLLYAYKGALLRGAMVNPSVLALQECGLYRYSSKRDAIEHPKEAPSDASAPSETRSFHGDRVIADAVLWLVLQSLGAGGVAALRPPPPEPVLVGSLAWRVQLAEDLSREGRHRHPIRWAGGPA